MSPFVKHANQFTSSPPVTPTRATVVSRFKFFYFLLIFRTAWISHTLGPKKTDDDVMLILGYPRNFGSPACILHEALCIVKGLN